MTLYEMNEQIEELYALLTNEDIDEQTVLDTIEAIGIEDKHEDYCKVILELKGDVQKISNEIDRLTKRKKAISNNVDKLRALLCESMVKLGKTKEDVGSFKLSVRETEALSIVDESKVPKMYFVEQEPKISKDLIKKAIKLGDTVDGCEIVKNRSVTIR